MRRAVNNNYQFLRATLIRKGTNLSRWARENNYPITTVYEAARGTRKGIIATRIKLELEQFAHSSSRS